MQMLYIDDDGTTVEYTLKTDPPEAIFWSTFKLQKSHIKIIGKMTREDAAMWRGKILDNILEREPNIRTTKRDKL